MTPKQRNVQLQILWGTQAALITRYTLESVDVTIQGLISRSVVIPPMFVKKMKTIVAEVTATNDKFIMPEIKAVDCETFGNSRQHRKLGGKSAKTKNIRSATPRGFAQAVFECNRGNKA